MKYTQNSNYFFLFLHVFPFPKEQTQNESILQDFWKYEIIMSVRSMNLYGMTRPLLEEYFVSIGEKKFKATQVFEWIYQKKIKNFEEMSNIKKEVREKLEHDFTLELPKIIKKESDVDVDKYLFELGDQERVEAVLMHHDYGRSVCVSSEVVMR